MGSTRTNTGLRGEGNWGIDGGAAAVPVASAPIQQHATGQTRRAVYHCSGLQRPASAATSAGSASQARGSWDTRSRSCILRAWFCSEHAARGFVAPSTNTRCKTSCDALATSTKGRTLQKKGEPVPLGMWRQTRAWSLAWPAPSHSSPHATISESLNALVACSRPARRRRVHACPQDHHQLLDRHPFTHPPTRNQATAHAPMPGNPTPCLAAGGTQQCWVCGGLPAQCAGSAWLQGNVAPPALVWWRR